MLPVEKLAGRAPGVLNDGDVRQFAVIAPYLPEEKAFLFEVRSQNLKRQPGEVCFPGGFIEEGETPRDAAVRETAEELLVERDAVEVVAPLDLLVTTHNTWVHPFLARLRGYEGTFSSDEVEEVFTIPLAFFLTTEPVVCYNRVSVIPDETFPWSRMGLASYPWREARYPVFFYQYRDRVVWGMTARIVRHIARLCRESS